MHLLGIGIDEAPITSQGGNPTRGVDATKIISTKITILGPLDKCCYRIRNTNTYMSVVEYE